MIADYRCKKCKHLFQKELKVAKFGDLAKLPKCPKCKSKNTVKLILFAPQVKFIGSGFYVTDNPKGK